MRVAIFTRVSTQDGRQNNERQVLELSELCRKQNWKVTNIIKESISGAKQMSERDGLKKLIDLARSKKIDKVVISEISRLGRKVSDGIKIIDELSECGVSIYIRNIGMETLLSDGKVNYMFKPILLTLMGFAEMEREQLRARVKSGLDAARKRGKKLGRPAGSNKDNAHVLKQYSKLAKDIKDGLSIRKAAKIHDVSTTTVQKVKRALKAA